MITLPDLKTAMLDILHEIRGTEIKLIIGGGFGIYLKIDHIQRTKIRTLFKKWPRPRSTNDFDLFSHPALLIESAKLKPFADSIIRLGYKVIPGVEKYQFTKPGPGGTKAGSIKIDILTGPVTCFDGIKIKADSRRVRPIPSIGIHAHPVNEAPTLEKGLFPIKIGGKLGSGESFSDEVFIPHPYAFSMMKLFAFRDRIHDENKEFGRYHALDLYSILATTTEDEWRYSITLKERYKNNSFVLEAAQLVKEYFSGPLRMGIIRLKESPYYSPDLQLDGFISVLPELFPSTSV